MQTILKCIVAVYIGRSISFCEENKDRSSVYVGIIAAIVLLFM